MEIEETNQRESDSQRLDEGVRWRIIGFYECCNNQRQTADYFQVNQSTVSRIISKYNTVRDVKDYFKAGRNSIVSTYDEERTMNMIEDNNLVTSKQIASDIKVSKPTALNLLYDLGFKFSIPIEIPMLNSDHILKRFMHAQSLMNRDLSNIVFCDESYFQQYRNTLGNWHKSDQGNYKAKPQTKISLMVYGAISYCGKSQLHIFDGGFQINSEIYCNVLKEIIIPFSQKQFYSEKKTRSQNQNTNWYLIQDNAPCHKSNMTKDFLVANKIVTIDHPPNSPDLNPIEQIWAILKKRVEKDDPKNKQELQSSILKQWELIELETVQQCIEHFKKRINKVYEIEGRFY